MSSTDTRKVTISMPEELIVFADRMAVTLGLTRSAFIAATLERARERERELLAEEGYRFFSSEAEEFAVASGSAIAEALDDESR